MNNAKGEPRCITFVVVLCLTLAIPVYEFVYDERAAIATAGRQKTTVINSKATTTPRCSPPRVVEGVFAVI